MDIHDPKMFAKHCKFIYNCHVQLYPCDVFLKKYNSLN